MLKLMRKHAKYFYVLFVIVILSFIFWGVGTVDEPTSLPVAEVEEEKVSLDEYWRAFDRWSDLYRDIYKDKFDEQMQKELQQKVLATLIEEKVLLVAAVEAGMAVSDREVEEAIINDTSFTRDGMFNREIYLRTLELNRLTPRYFEAAKRRELLLQKMRWLVRESVDLSPSELKTAGGDEDRMQAMLEAKRQAALMSFIQGLKKRMSIKVNQDLIS